jgi:hypothetical protein
LNPGRRGGKPATNRLSYGAAHAGDLTGEKISLFGEISSMAMFGSHRMVITKSSNFAMLI